MSTAQTILSNTKVVVNRVELVLVKESAPSIEVGTDSNPLFFDNVIAGETTLHPDNPFLLYNDRTGSQDSVDAKNITVDILEMHIVDELVGTSDGTADQVFSVAFPPVIQGDLDNAVYVKVGVTSWTEVQSFAGAANTDEVFVVDYTNGTITFGNGVNGAIPANGELIYVTYSPNTATYGVEARDDGWFGVQSADVDRNDRTILLNPSDVIDTTQVQLVHIPLISVSAVQGIWLPDDPNRLGTNYFTGGSYNDVTGVVILGTVLPGGITQVLADYKYTIADDAESDFAQLSTNVTHTFDNPIPSRNAKKLNFHLVVPAGVSPTNGVHIKIRFRISYTEF